MILAETVAVDGRVWKVGLQEYSSTSWKYSRLPTWAPTNFVFNSVIRVKGPGESAFELSYSALNTEKRYISNFQPELIEIINRAYNGVSLSSIPSCRCSPPLVPSPLHTADIIRTSFPSLNKLPFQYRLNSLYRVFWIIFLFFRD